MELQGIVDRYAEGLAFVDESTATERHNQRTGALYLPGLRSLGERLAVEELDAWWAQSYPADFAPPNRHETQYPYSGTPPATCDHVITTDDGEDLPEWGIEVKSPVLIGDNGKRNDYAVAKMLSPYLKDRSLYHDIIRLRQRPIARRHAAIGFAFTYDLETCRRAAELHPAEVPRIKEIEKVCVGNGGSLSVRPMVEFAQGIFQIRELIDGHYVHATFEAWRHPCGGRGVVFGWEVRSESGSNAGPEFDW